jgi:hypothetical protein
MTLSTALVAALAAVSLASPPATAPTATLESGSGSTVTRPLSGADQQGNGAYLAGGATCCTG